MRAHQFATLDGLRGIAAVAVAVLHLSAAFGGVGLPNAHLAVDFFLQVSGFIVAYAYGSRIVAGMSLGQFARRRIGRLYPAFLLGIVLGAVALLVIGRGGAGLWCAIPANVLMLPQPCGYGPLLFPLNAPMWTIAFEILFSFVFFFTAAWLLVRRHVLITVGVALVVLIVAAPPTLNVGSRYESVGFALIRLGFSFLVGVLIYTVSIRIRRRSNLVCGLLPLLLLLALLFPYPSREYELLLVTVGFPLILITGIVYSAPDYQPMRWVLLQLGALSYTLYVIHVPLFLIVEHFAPDLLVGPWVGVFVLSAFVVIAWVLARTYEPWARRLFDRVTSPGLVHA